MPVAAIFGANASGKTNVILALRFMRDAVRNSHARWEPGAPIELQPFASQPASPATFAADFLLDRVRYQYGFTVSTEAVLEEWLYAYPSGKKQTWFCREKGKPISFSVKMPGDNRTIEGLTRPNSLFLSAAAQNNHQALSPVFRWFAQSLSFVVGGRSGIGRRTVAVCGDARSREKVARWLSWADLGIEDLRVLDSKEIVFMHRLGDSAVAFREAQESKGTIAFLSLLAPVLRALETGGLVCIDELDHSLHPLLAIELIRLFSDAKRNPTGAQLIFTTHDTNLLNADTLRRDQIWFTEKGRDGASRLYPLTDFKPRREENLGSGYAQGRYGAIPLLDPERFPG